MKTTTIDSELEALSTREGQMSRAIAALEQRVVLLEEENARLARMLRERGLAPRPVSQVADELPTPLEQALPPDDPAFAAMRPEEKALFEELAAGAPCFMLLCSQTKIDTGHWFRRSRVYAAVFADRLALFAWGKRPWTESVLFRHLRQSLYNHVTGEIVFAPAHGLRVGRLCLLPLNGAQVLAQIYANKEDDNA